MKRKSSGRSVPDIPEGLPEGTHHAGKPHPSSARAHSAPRAPKLILVPLDFSDGSLCALDWARVIAEPLAARLILFHVVEPDGYPPNGLEVANSLDQANQNHLAACRDRLQEIGRKRIGHHVPLEILVRIGHAQSEIPDTAKAMGVDLIVLGIHGETALKPFALGSTAERVLQHATCPVLAVPHA